MTPMTYVRMSGRTVAAEDARTVCNHCERMIEMCLSAPCPKRARRELEGLGGSVPMPMPLAGHAGYCAKALIATFEGRADGPCSCGRNDGGEHGQEKGRR